MTYEEKGFSSEIQSIYLVDERIEEIENYLETTYGYEPKSVKRQYVEGMIATDGGLSPAGGGGGGRVRRGAGGPPPATTRSRITG